MLFVLYLKVCYENKCCHFTVINLFSYFIKVFLNQANFHKIKLIFYITIEFFFLYYIFYKISRPNNYFSKKVPIFLITIHYNLYHLYWINLKETTFGLEGRTLMTLFSLDGRSHFTSIVYVVAYLISVTSIYVEYFSQYEIIW